MSIGVPQIDYNSMLRNADVNMTTNETENSGNALVVDLGPGSGYFGLWLWISNPTTITGTTPGQTITFRTSPDKTTWTSVTDPPPPVITAAGMYIYPFQTNQRYVSYASARGNADNTASAISIGITDAVMLGPR